MKQQNTEEVVQHTDDQQNTGNHKKPGTPGSGAADRIGGTRKGAENLESDGRDESHRRSRS